MLLLFESVDRLSIRLRVDLFKLAGASRTDACHVWFCDVSVSDSDSASAAGVSVEASTERTEQTRRWQSSETTSSKFPTSLCSPFHLAYGDSLQYFPLLSLHPTLTLVNRGDHRHITRGCRARKCMSSLRMRSDTGKVHNAP
jgi:Tfp pilus assembly major pilin PilA